MLDENDQVPIYLDNHATTPVDPRVADVIMHTMMSAYGNPNSVDHAFGDRAAALVIEAQREIASLVGGESEGVHFASGSSEALHLALAHAVATRPRLDAPLRVAVSTVEHRAVLEAVTSFERAGKLSPRWIPVDRRARLDLATLQAACETGIDLICVMAANNEVGTLYPIEQIARIARDTGATTLVDATQAAGRAPIRATEWGITYLALSAHKMYGPKGIGALVTSPDLFMRPAHGRIPGTGSGTPNVPGIVGLGEACRLRRLEMSFDEPRIAAQRNHLETLLLAGIDDLAINGDREHRLSNNLHIAVPGIPNDAVLARVRRQVAVSTGAACSSGVEEPSHVLRAMGLPEALQDGALRIGLGKFTTDDEIERAGAHLVTAVRDTCRTMARR